MDTERTQRLIETFLDKLSVEYESVHYIADAIHPIFAIRTNDAKKLIGSQGENLKALNFLLKRIVEKRENISHPSFLVDVNNYQQERNDELRKKAKIMIERVRSFRTNVELEPLNAYERMLVHSMVADDPEIETESTGTGPLKRITIRYKQVDDNTTPYGGDSALFS